MRHEEFENICKAVKTGQEKQVKHIVTHQVGKIVACETGEEFFEVEVKGGEHKNWSKENVKEA